MAEIKQDHKSIWEVCLPSCFCVMDSRAENWAAMSSGACDVYRLFDPVKSCRGYSGSINGSLMGPTESEQAESWHNKWIKKVQSVQLMTPLCAGCFLMCCPRLRPPTAGFSLPHFYPVTIPSGISRGWQRLSAALQTPGNNAAQYSQGDIYSSVWPYFTFSVTLSH